MTIDLSGLPKISNLLNPSTEAVVGLERCASIVEGTNNVYETQFFIPLLKIFGNQKLNEDVKIIMDHIKTLCFILAEEKIVPAKNKRGRIIRTLVRELLSSFYILELNVENYLPKLINRVISMYKINYPEIQKSENNVLDIIYSHEKIYKKTLNKGLTELSKLKSVNRKIGKKETIFYWEKYDLPPKLFNKTVRNNIK